MPKFLRFEPPHVGCYNKRDFVESRSGAVA